MGSTAPAKRRVLVVDDERIVVEVMQRYLRRDGFSVAVAYSGPEALVAATSAPHPDLIVLDVMLPGIDGVAVCRALRRDHRLRVPILLLTARGAEADRVAGLETGADDYIVKPFSPSEVVARVRAHLRRVELDHEPPEADGRIAGGDVALDTRLRVVTVRGSQVVLTAKEFDLLQHLMTHRGKPLTRDELLDAVWDAEFVGGPSTVTVHVRRLREKIERDPARPTHIKTVWGAGYKFDPVDP